MRPSHIAVHRFEISQEYYEKLHELSGSRAAPRNSFTFMLTYHISAASLIPHLDSYWKWSLFSIWLPPICIDSYDICEWNTVFYLLSEFGSICKHWLPSTPSRIFVYSCWKWLKQSSWIRWSCVIFYHDMSWHITILWTQLKGNWDHVGMISSKKTLFLMWCVPQRYHCWVNCQFIRVYVVVLCFCHHRQ